MRIQSLCVTQRGVSIVSMYERNILQFETSSLRSLGTNNFMPVITTLNYAGRTEEALNFYKESLDAEILFLMRFCDSPDQSYTLPGKENLIFHATYRIDGTVFMASDVGSNEPPLTNAFSGFALALRMSSVDRATHVFDALAKEGRVLIPLAESAFTSMYGMVIDKFGIPWKVTVDQQIE